MAKSKYAYVKQFEDEDSLLPHTWGVVRIDGRAFTRWEQTSLSVVWSALFPPGRQLLFRDCCHVMVLFSRFSEVHGFQKPNDEPALQLMNESAKAVLEDMPDFVFAYGESDEYRYNLRPCSPSQRVGKLEVVAVVRLYAACTTFCLPDAHVAALFCRKPANCTTDVKGRVNLCSCS